MAESVLPDETRLPPIEMLAAWFEAQQLPVERVGEDEIVASVRGSWGSYELRGIFRADDAALQFIAFPDVTASDSQRAVMHEAVNLINEQLWLGHFECWSSDGTLAFRHAVLLPEGDPELDAATADTIVGTAIDELDRYYPVFQFVLWGGKTPREALTAAMVDTRGEA